MSTTAELLKGAAELFPDEVVTQAHVRHLDLPVRRGPLRAHHAGQRLRPHQADHLRPAVAGEPERRHRPGREGGRGRRDRRRRRHRQAVHLRGRRRPQGRRAAEAATRTRWPSARAATTSSSALPQLAVPTFAYYNGAAMGGGVEVGLHCTYRTVSAALPGLLAARGLPRPGPRLGRLHAAAEPDRRRPRGRASSSRTRSTRTSSSRASRSTNSASPTRSSRAPTSWSSRCSGPRPSSRARSRSCAPRSTAARPGTRPSRAGRPIADTKVHGAAPAAYRALDIIAAAKNGDLRSRASTPRTRRSPT